MIWWVYVCLSIPINGYCLLVLFAVLRGWNKGLRPICQVSQCQICIALKFKNICFAVFSEFYNQNAVMNGELFYLSNTQIGKPYRVVNFLNKLSYVDSGFQFINSRSLLYSPNNTCCWSQVMSLEVHFKSHCLRFNTPYRHFAVILLKEWGCLITATFPETTGIVLKQTFMFNKKNGDYLNRLLTRWLDST